MSRLPRRAGEALAAASLDAAARSARARRGRRVHSVRVAAKRLRAFWRVLRFSVGARESRRRRRALARGVRMLAAARERDALRALAARLARSEGDLAPALAVFLRRFPPPRSPATLARMLDRAASELEASACALAAAARSSRRADLREGLKALKRKLRRARERAVRRRAAPAELHECRKRAKDLQFILEALDIAPDSVRAYRKAADKLGAARDLRLLASRAGLRDGSLEKTARKDEAAALARLGRS